jgi:hypothetical protein
MEKRMGSTWKVVAWRRFAASPEAVWSVLGIDAEGALALDGVLGPVERLGDGRWTVDAPSRARRVSAGTDQRVRVERAIGDRSRLVIEAVIVREGRWAAWRARWAARSAGRAASAALRAIGLAGDEEAGLRVHPLPPAMAAHADDALGTLLDVSRPGGLR